MEWVLEEQTPEAVGILRRELVRATRDARAQQRRLVLVTGSERIDRMLVVSGVGQALVETTPDPAILDE